MMIKLYSRQECKKEKYAALNGTQKTMDALANFGTFCYVMHFNLLLLKSCTIIAIINFTPQRDQNKISGFVPK